MPLSIIKINSKWQKNKNSKEKGYQMGLNKKANDQ